MGRTENGTEKFHKNVLPGAFRQQFGYILRKVIRQQRHGLTFGTGKIGADVDKCSS